MVRSGDKARDPHSRVSSNRHIDRVGSAPGAGGRDRGHQTQTRQRRCGSRSGTLSCCPPLSVPMRPAGRRCRPGRAVRVRGRGEWKSSPRKRRFSELILDGEKTVELRRVAPSLAPAALMILYASSPAMEWSAPLGWRRSRRPVRPRSAAATAPGAVSCAATTRPTSLVRGRRWRSSWRRCGGCPSRCHRPSYGSGGPGSAHRRAGGMWT
jgi:hypothetical protein